jgi:peptide/nickel transport system permease protein
MVAYLSRRLGMMLLIVFGASYLAYNLEAFVANPLAGFKESTEENKDYLIAKTIKDLNLDVPPPLRYFIWFRGIIAGLWGQLDLGLTQSKSPVIDEILTAIPTTFRLVFASTVLAIVLGITIGVITAIRQYSRFDYSMTFVAFLLFSLPVFWVAVLLKEYLAIGFNDFLVEPVITPPWLIGISLILGLVIAGVLGGSKTRFASTWIGSTILSALTLMFMSATSWFSNPGLGVVGVAIIAFGFAILIVHLTSGVDNRPALFSGLSAAAIVTLAYFPLQAIFVPSSNLFTILLSAVAILFLAGTAGFLASKTDRLVNIRISALTAFIAFLPIVLDRFMQEFGDYANSDAVRGRPVPTIAQDKLSLLSEDQVGNFWVVGLDALMHLILPTITLTLISFAGYVRFSRGSLLEVMNLDFVRTARAKGLPERTIITRHALRNAMLPLTTILVNDFAGVIGGAIITESVFGWKGMGQLFNGAIRTADLNLFMGVFLISATLTVLANLLADLLFGVVDPRIRIRK